MTDCLGFACRRDSTLEILAEYWIECAFFMITDSLHQSVEEMYSQKGGELPANVQVVLHCSMASLKTSVCGVPCHHTCIGKLGHHWFRLWPVACLAPCHYSNKRWYVANWALINKFQWHFNRNSTIFINEKEWTLKCRLRDDAHFVSGFIQELWHVTRNDLVISQIEPIMTASNYWESPALNL